MVPDYHAHASIAQGTDPLQTYVSVLSVNSSYKGVGSCFELLNMRGSRLPHMLHFNQPYPCEILKPVTRVCHVQYITPHRLTYRRLNFHFRLLTNCSFKSGEECTTNEGKDKWFDLETEVQRRERGTGLYRLI